MKPAREFLVTTTDENGIPTEHKVTAFGVEFDAKWVLHKQTGIPLERMTAKAVRKYRKSKYY